MDQILRRQEVEALFGISRSTIYQSMSEGRFPRPIKLGRRAVGWSKADLEQWLSDQRKQS